MELFKAHGTGNDFVVLPDPEGVVDLDAATAVALCDRRFGIGGDGVLRLAPSERGHVFMDYRNAGDGEPVEMCGNGVRVVAAHLVEHGWTTDAELRIDTRDGVKTATVETDDGRVTSVTVDMGPPRFADEALPYTGPAAAPDGWRPLVVGDATTPVLTVSMGNPHAVLLVDDPAEAPVDSLGPRIERHDAFPKGTNVEFVTVHDRTHADLRVWERAVGETLACGTGVCGAVAALARVDRLDTGTPVTVTVRGGTLQVQWAGGDDDPVLLTGPAEEIARVTPTSGFLRRVGLRVAATAGADAEN